MASKLISTPGTRLGTQFRGKLAAAYGKRGVGPNSLWYVYSPRTRRDWVLRSDLEWDHFVLAESDPDIVDCDYVPDRQCVVFDGDERTIPVDAIVTYQDGRIEWRHIRFAPQRHNESSSPKTLRLEQCNAAAKQADVLYSQLSDDTIRRNPLLLANWRRVLAWMAAARDRSLISLQDELAAIFRAETTLTLGRIETMFGEASFALYAAALFGELQRGTYQSDLDEAPLSLRTVIRVR